MTTPLWLLTAITSQTSSQRVDISVIDIVLESGPVSQSVILILFIFSIVSWGIMFHKYRLFRVVGRETSDFRDFFSRRNQLEQVYTYAKKMKNCPMARVFLAGYIELATQFRLTQAERTDDDDDMLLEKLDSISRALERATAQEVTKLEKWLIFLGTAGSTSPFIGLFGTVWGVMVAFAGIGVKGTANVAVVAPGISEALIATAAGLFVAIPSVIGYNYFINKVKTSGTDMDNFSLDMLSLIDRTYIKRST